MAESEPSIVWNGWRTPGPTHPVTQISRNHDERPTWQVKWWWLIVALFFLGSVGSRVGRAEMRWISEHRRGRRALPKSSHG
jgi:hypothetical protein